jgi:uncharacterized protein
VRTRRPEVVGVKPAFSLSGKEARQMVLRAQGFADNSAVQPRPRKLAAMVRQLGLLQIDSVNVLVRAHYMPLFSRLGRYSREQLDELSYRRGKRIFFEYWGHEASLIPLEYFPFFRWRMHRAERGEEIYQSLARLAHDRPDFVDAVFAEVGARGPISAGQLQKALVGSSAIGTRGWWGWTDSKRALEWLFWTGKITTAFRRNFERVYDLTERVFPKQILEAVPSEEEAQRELVRLAARALGVATESDLRDYFRLDVAETRTRIAELVEMGDLLQGEVDGWSRPAFAVPDLRIPRRLEGSALLSPFDPLIWERSRTERLFDFKYRIEIYTPAARRQHGYYVLPFLLKNRLLGRVDLKADRQRSVLEVRSAHAEPGAVPLEFADVLTGELKKLAAWLELAEIELHQRGNAAKWLIGNW